MLDFNRGNYAIKYNSFDNQMLKSKLSYYIFKNTDQKADQWNEIFSLHDFEKLEQRVTHFCLYQKSIDDMKNSVE